MQNLQFFISIEKAMRLFGPLSAVSFSKRQKSSPLDD
uniref:Uncharacterized protein n=1 Tax=Rhizophora mucronata TaxID=61149 RepID=A0A2P2P510_RHIMU